MQIDPNDPRTWPESARAFLRRREQAAVGNADLAALLRARIRENGPLTFAEFMREALYHPEHGYYASSAPKIGPEGDFLTSPVTHPAFGALVCRRLVRMWETLGSPARFDVVECGPGTGALAVQILGFAAQRHPAFRQAVTYTLVETSASLRERQQARLAGWADGISWTADLESIAPGSVYGCILSNELLDALPVHRVQMTDAGLREIYVGLDAEKFTDVPGPLSSPALAAFFESVGVYPPAGAQAEVGLAAGEWYHRAADRLGRGYLLTIDYGCAAAELYTPNRPRGTLLCYYRHTANEEPYRRVGCQDITAHVNYTTLMQVGEAVGLHTCEYATQREWLGALGIEEWARRQERWPEEEPHPFRDLRALVDPEILGRLQVLVQARLEG